MAIQQPVNFIKKWRWRAMFICLGILVAAILHFRPNGEPIRDGRTLGFLFHQAEMEPNVVPSAPYTQAIRSMGGDAVPYLVAKLRGGDGAWVEFYWNRYPKLPKRLQKALPAPRRPGARQETAAMMLARIGPEARAAFPDMLAVYSRAYCRRYLLPISSQVDWPAQCTNRPASMLPGGPVPLPEGTMRSWLLSALCSTGDDHRETVPLLLATIHETDANFATTGSYYVNSLTNLAHATELAEPAVVGALNDSVANMRAAAATLLGALGPNHPELIPPLMKAAEDPRPEVRQCALRSLPKTQASFEMLLPLLSRLLEDPDPATHSLAAMKLIYVAGGSKLLNTLTETLENRDPLMRAAAARALREFGPRSTPAIRKLTALSKEANEPDPHVREEAAAALAKITPRNISR